MHVNYMHIYTHIHIHILKWYLSSGWCWGIQVLSLSVVNPFIHLYIQIYILTYSNIYINNTSLLDAVVVLKYWVFPSSIHSFSRSSWLKSLSDADFCDLFKSMHNNRYFNIYLYIIYVHKFLSSPLKSLSNVDSCDLF